jgi:hypothetical protein
MEFMIGKWFLCWSGSPDLLGSWAPANSFDRSCITRVAGTVGGGDSIERSSYMDEDCIHNYVYKLDTI